MQNGNPVIQVASSNYMFCLWLNWDSHTALFNFKPHGLFSTSGRFKIFTWLEVSNKIQGVQLKLNFR